MGGLSCMVESLTYYPHAFNELKQPMPHLTVREPSGSGLSGDTATPRIN